MCHTKWKIENIDGVWIILDNLELPSNNLGLYLYNNIYIDITRKIQQSVLI